MTDSMEFKSTAFRNVEDEDALTIPDEIMEWEQQMDQTRGR